MGILDALLGRKEKTETQQTQTTSERQQSRAQETESRRAQVTGSAVRSEQSASQRGTREQRRRTELAAGDIERLRGLVDLLAGNVTALETGTREDQANLFRNLGITSEALQARAEEIPAAIEQIVNLTRAAAQEEFGRTTAPVIEQAIGAGGSSLNTFAQLARTQGAADLATRLGTVEASTRLGGEELINQLLGESARAAQGAAATGSGVLTGASTRALDALRTLRGAETVETGDIVDVLSSVFTGTEQTRESVLETILSELIQSGTATATTEGAATGRARSRDSILDAITGIASVLPTPVR